MSFSPNTPRRPPIKPQPANVFNTESDKKDGAITTLNITVVHSSYYFSIRPEDILYDQTGLGRAWSVEKVKLNGGSGKVSQCELSLKLTDTTSGSRPAPVKFQELFSTVL
jgi:hypothetical protein